MVRSTKFSLSFLPFIRVLLGVVFLVECSKPASSPPPNQQQPPPSAEAPKAAKEAAQGQIVEQDDLIPEIPRYEYNPLGKRDPFQDYKIPELQSSPESPLTGFELKSLRLVGILAGASDTKAVFEAPDSKSYVIQTGQKIGRNDGTIVKILPEEVVVVEKRIDRSGNLRDEQVSLYLYLTSNQGGTP